MTSSKCHDNSRPNSIVVGAVLPAACFLLILCVAAAYRAPRLDERPVHGDEANQAMKTGILYDDGHYEYDPHEHHGPTLYYLALPLLTMQGMSSYEESSIAMYRRLTVLFGLLLILLLWPLREALGTGAVLWAALFLALSHAMTFYSRYYIQEMLLICFVQCALVAGWRYLRHPSFLWAVPGGMALGLIHATKETAIIIAFAGGLAMAATMLLARLREKRPLAAQVGAILHTTTVKHLAVAGLAAVLVSVALFSSFFSHGRGPLDSLLTYADYFSRAEGTGSAGMHDKPWYYYLQLLFYFNRQAGPRWSEAQVLLAGLAGAAVVLFRRARPEAGTAAPVVRALSFQRFILVYTLTTMLVYSLIPYKTPWNLLVFYHGVILLAGVGAAAIVRAGRWKIVQGLLVLAILGALAPLARQNYQGNFIYYADTRNPYVYAHPSKAVERLAARIADIAAVSEHGNALHVNVIRPDGDYWPLPWYLRTYSRVGWWHQLPDPPDADILLAAPRLYEVLQERLQEDYQVEFHALRPGVLLHAYIRQDLWEAFIATRTQ